MLFHVDRKSEAYNKITKAGFHIHDILCEEIQGYFGAYVLTIPFNCVCGKKEVLILSACDWEFHNNTIDIAYILEKKGAIAEEHLRSDGYTEDEICKIREPYNNLKEVA